MTSFGRGRGWSAHSQDQNLRRPSGVLGTNKIVRDIMDKIVSCDENECLSSQLMNEIVDLLIVAYKEENLRHVCNSIWKRAMYQHTTRIAMIFSNNKIALLECGTTNLRGNFLRFLQENYMSKEIYRENKETFANNVLLHAEVYYHMRMSNGSRLEILAEPLIQYMKDLLQDNPQDTTYFIMIQILRSGKDLNMACPEELENLIMTIRQLIVKENFHNPENNAALLLIVELANNGYEIKDTQVQHFYLSNIKSISFEHPFSHEELKVIATKIENDNQLSEVDNIQRIVKEEMKNDTSEYSSYSKNSNVPRAIRGSGALDKSKKGMNINAKSNLLRTTRERNKNWGHDDRFHEHYE
ncbi:hypothetical protein P5V15_007575 [Pogonomyrmex californicus]